MNTTVLTPTKTHTSRADALNMAPRPTLAQLGRTLVHRWDMAAMACLLVSCGAYGFYAVTQMTGF